MQNINSHPKDFFHVVKDKVAFAETLLKKAIEDGDAVGTKHYLRVLDDLQAMNYCTAQV